MPSPGALAPRYSSERSAEMPGGFRTTPFCKRVSPRLPEAFQSTPRAPRVGCPENEGLS